MDGQSVDAVEATPSPKPTATEFWTDTTPAAANFSKHEVIWVVNITKVLSCIRIHSSSASPEARRWMFLTFKLFIVPQSFWPGAFPMNLLGELFKDSQPSPQSCRSVGVK